MTEWEEQIIMQALGLLEQLAADVRELKEHLVPTEIEVPMLKGENVCQSLKWGEFNPLRCARQKGHDGPHNFVVAMREEGENRG